jgi:UDP-glucose 4-epimerase
MKWLITGGCGFIGTSLIRSLVEQGGHYVRVLDNLTTGTRDDLALVAEFSDRTGSELSEQFGRVELVEGDILDEKIVRDVSEGMDVIVHLAANTGVGPSVEDPRKDCMTNVVGTFNMLEAARFNQIKRFVFASSGAPAGEVVPPIHEELPPHPVSPYGASKLAGEGYCSAYKRSFEMDTVALRFGNVYGPGSVHKSSVVAKFIKQALDGEQLEIYGDGTQTRDFIFIDDLTRAIELAATGDNIGGETFQIASNRETTVHEMTELLVELLSQKIGIEVNVINGQVRVGDVKRNYSDTTKARTRLQWQPKITLNDGLAKTIDYFLKQRTMA